jgi:hypothetical protein
MNRKDFSILEPYVDSNISTLGITGTRDTAGSYARLTGLFMLGVPFILTSIQWYIRNSSTYTLDFLSTGSGSASILNIATNVALTGGALNTLILPKNVLLKPGKLYYPSCKKDTSTTSWRDADVTPYYLEPMSIGDSTWYDGVFYAFKIPIKLIGHKILIDRYLNLPQEL